MYIAVDDASSTAAAADNIEQNLPFGTHNIVDSRRGGDTETKGPSYQKQLRQGSSWWVVEDLSVVFYFEASGGMTIWYSQIKPALKRHYPIRFVILRN